MLPHDYPDTFAHQGLNEAWFSGIPWSIQEKVVGVDPKLRCVRNPATAVFVVVLRLSGEDPKQVHNFFGVCRLVGWAPIVESRRGEPVESIARLCEGMQANARIFSERYGETTEQIDAALKGDRRRVERLRTEAMLESTAFARHFAQDFAAKHLAMTVSNAKGGRLYQQAQKEFRQERERRRKIAEGEPLILVSR